jgi:hypothetical protein
MKPKTGNLTKVLELITATFRIHTIQQRARFKNGLQSLEIPYQGHVVCVIVDAHRAMDDRTAVAKIVVLVL